MASPLLAREPGKGSESGSSGDLVGDRSRRRNHAVSFLTFLILGFIFTLPGSVSPASGLLGIPGDNFQHAWFLWHFARALAHAKNPFFTTLIYYPSGANLAWSTTDPLAGILALPLSLLAGPAIAYNLSIVLQLALSAFFARLLCLQIVRNEASAFFGGLIFGFSPFFLAHALGHLSLITAFPIPLFVLLLDRIFSQQNPSWRMGVGLGAALILAGLAHYNYVVLCLLFGFFWLMIELIENSRSMMRVLQQTWKPLCAAAITFGIGFSPLLWMLIGKRSSVPVSRSFDHIEQFSADALGFMVPSWNHILLGRFVRNWNPQIFVAGFEGTVYIGTIVLALAAIGFSRAPHSNRKWVVRAFILGGIFYLLSLGPQVRLLAHPTGVPGPAALFYRLPFAQFISAPARFHAAVALCLAILASFGIKFLLHKCANRRRRYSVVLIFAVLVLADYLTIPFPRSSTVDPAVEASTGWSAQRPAQACDLPAALRHGTILTFPLVRAPYCMKAMWMQAASGGRYALVDGYLSYAPQETWKTFWNVRLLRSMLGLQGMLNTPVHVAADRESVASAIRELNLSAIVVFDSPERSAGISYVEHAFEAEGERAGSCTVFSIKPHSSALETSRTDPLTPAASDRPATSTKAP